MIYKRACQISRHFRIANEIIRHIFFSSCALITFNLWHRIRNSLVFYAVFVSIWLPGFQDFCEHYMCVKFVDVHWKSNFFYLIWLKNWKLIFFVSLNWFDLFYFFFILQSKPYFCSLKFCVAKKLHLKTEIRSILLETAWKLSANRSNFAECKKPATIRKIFMRITFSASN